MTDEIRLKLLPTHQGHQGEIREWVCPCGCGAELTIAAGVMWHEGGALATVRFVESTGL